MIGIKNINNSPSVINLNDKDGFNLINLNEFYMIIEKLVGKERNNNRWASGYLLVSFAVSEFERATAPYMVVMKPTTRMIVPRTYSWPCQLLSHLIPNK